MTTLHLHRRLTIQPHVLVSSDLQVPLQHVEQHGELQKNVSGRSRIKYYISPPERRWAPCPPSPWSWAACRPTAGTFLLGKAVILEVPLKMPSLSWLVWSSMISKPWNLSHIEGGCQGRGVRYIGRSRKSCGCRSRTLSAGPRRQKSFEDTGDPGYTIIKHLRLLPPR